MAIYQDSLIVNPPLLLISGQTPQQGDLIPETIEEQLDIVINKIDAIIKANNAQKQNVVKMGIYITDNAYLSAVREKITDYLQDIKPVMTLIVVAGLVNDSFKVEIDATVAINK